MILTSPDPKTIPLYSYPAVNEKQAFPLANTAHTFTRQISENLFLILIVIIKSFVKLFSQLKDFFENKFGSRRNKQL